MKHGKSKEEEEVGGQHEISGDGDLGQTR